MFKLHKKTQAKILPLLVLLNILFLLFIFSYLTNIQYPWNKNKAELPTAEHRPESSPPSPTIIPAASISAESTNQPEVAEKEEQRPDFDKALNEILYDTTVDSQTSTETTEKALPEKTETVEVYYDGRLARIEETDSEGNQLITISRSLDDIGELSQNDASYVAALNELKKGTRSHITISKTSTEDAMSFQAEQAKPEQSTNYYNKIDISDRRPKSIDQATLADKIALVVSEPEPDSTVTESIPDSDNDSYIETLKTESVERLNEMRTIQVVSGDTLWELAVKAYGSGYEYPRIFRANPHLTSPDKIQVGDYLRVPL